jgi:hypothetical protein
LEGLTRASPELAFCILRSSSSFFIFHSSIFNLQSAICNLQSIVILSEAKDLGFSWSPPNAQMLRCAQPLRPQSRRDATLVAQHASAGKRDTELFPESRRDGKVTA